MTQKDIAEAAKHLYVYLNVLVLTKVICTYAPLFLISPWSTILSKILNLGFGKLSDLLDKAGYFVYSDLTITKEGRDFVKAKMDGKLAQTLNDPTMIKRAENEIKNTLIKLVRLT